MGLKLYLFSIYATILISLGLSLLLVFNVNPFQAPFWIITLFYLTVCLFFTATFALIGFYLKVKASNREVIFNHLIPTLRQSLLLSLFIISILFLQQIKVVNWWILILMAVIFILLELFYRSRKTYRKI